MEKILNELATIKRYTLLAAKNVLTIEDVVLLTGLSKSHIHKLTCGRKIPFYRPSGKYIYFDRIEIEEWLKKNRHDTNEEIDQQAAAYLAGKGVKEV